MNILLTGGAGFIGSHTAIVLSEAGHNISIVDNFDNSSSVNLYNLEKIIGKKVNFVEGDIRDTKLLTQALKDFKVDGVIHFAGLKCVGDSVVSPLNYYDTNIAGTISLLKAMQDLSIKNLVFSSSSTVYGNPQYLPIDEPHPLSPINPYGKTKLFVEQLLRDVALSDKSFKAINLRYFNPAGAHASGILGEHPRGTPNNLMPFIAKVALNQIPELKIFGDNYDTFDGTGVRDYIHVMDLARGHEAAINFLPKMSGFEVFNLGTGSGYSVLQMIKAYQVASGKEIPYEVIQNRLGDVASCYASVDKANKVLNWHAKLTLQDMCNDSWKFAQQVMSVD